MGFEIWGEWLFIFRGLGSTGNFKGAGEQAHSFGDLGSPEKKQKNTPTPQKITGKSSILFDFLKLLQLRGGERGVG